MLRTYQLVLNFISSYLNGGWNSEKKMLMIKIGSTNLDQPRHQNRQKAFFWKRYHKAGIQKIGDLRFDRNNIESYESVAKQQTSDP